MADLLGSLGHYRAGDVDLLLRPSLRDVEHALDRLAARAAEARQRGEDAQALFYYSGHARANALNLAGDELPLDDLRARLVALPATITIVVLDACQSGAISHIKGAEPTADFSFNSVNRLTNTGIAVMASSTGTELSQESEALRSSYFTHHLLVGLRGAGDADRDGRVTLVEAYRYAYNQTLSATAATAVGSQHATLETGLRGKGEVVLTYPAAASAQMELPAALDGELLVRAEPSGAVLVEMHKAEGRAVRLALSPGRYEVIHRTGARARRCELALADHNVAVLDPARCADVEAVAVAAKGPGTPPRTRWIVQAALGAIAARNDALYPAPSGLRLPRHDLLRHPALLRAGGAPVDAALRARPRARQPGRAGLPPRLDHDAVGPERTLLVGRLLAGRRRARRVPTLARPLAPVRARRPGTDLRTQQLSGDRRR